MPTRWDAALFAAGFGTAAVLAEPPAPRPRDSTPATPARIAEWVRDLGSPDFRRREAATRELANRPEAIPALRQVVRSTDAEVAWRAGELLDEIARRTAAKVRRELT